MRLFDAPHIPYFLGGLAQVLTALIAWAVWLLGAFAGAYDLPDLAVSPVALHGFLMIYGVFAFFVFGFLATTFPRWMQSAPLPRRGYRNAFVLRVAGLVLVYAGLAFGDRALVPGAMLMAAGDARLTADLIGVYRRARKTARRGVLLFIGTLTAEVAGLVLYAASFWHGSAVSPIVAIRMGLFVFLVPTLFAVSYRMIPFFTASVLSDYRRPFTDPRVPMAFLAASAAHALLAGLHGYAVLAVLDIAIAAVAWYHLVAWFRQDVMRHGLLVLLYAGYTWLGIGFALYAVRNAALALGHDILGRGPLHALGIGFALSLVVAMVTRVTRGHSGRPLASDTLSWTALLGIEVAAVLRIAAALAPPDGLAPYDLSVCAALIAIAALLPWAARYAAMLTTTHRAPQS
ncbi:NnrS family protein [Acidiferrobacter sp.]|uniref:NnrS family protein n=1 Tax=Acidiferrobacter sp. TaxID=1872107 RepID=UPI002612F87C|nr:NnrS family protein [Acidiferrobacter sp.]